MVDDTNHHFPGTVWCFNCLKKRFVYCSVYLCVIL